MLALSSISQSSLYPAPAPSNQSALSSPSSSPPPTAHRALTPLRPRRPAPLTPYTSKIKLNTRVPSAASDRSATYLASASSPGAESPAASSDSDEEEETDVPPSDPPGSDAHPHSGKSTLPFSFPQSALLFSYPYRARDPAPGPPAPSTPHAYTHPQPARPTSPVSLRRQMNAHRSSSSVVGTSTLLPKHFELGWGRWKGKVDVRRAGEAALLVGPFSGVLWTLAKRGETCMASEGAALILVALLTLSLSGFRGQKAPTNTIPPLNASLAPNPSAHPSASHPKPPHQPHTRRQSFPHPAQPPPNTVKSEPEKDWDIGRLWMTSPRDYRASLDSGLLTALLLGPFLSASALLVTLPSSSPETPLGPLSARWLVEAPLQAGTGGVIEALTRARRNMFEMSSLCSFLIAIQFELSRRAERRLARQNDGCAQGGGTVAGAAGGGGKRECAEGVPKEELSRLGSYVAVVLLTAGAAVGVKALAVWGGSYLWSELSMFDVIVVSLFYQFCLYVMIRLARRGFTLGELCFVAQTATALVMETTNLTISRIWPLSTPYIKTFRLPTPLLIYQLALIPGCLLAGFLLSPLLVLSRTIAQKPLHRLRFPREKLVHRRWLAAGVYAGFALFIGGVVGVWTQWCLGGRNPWAYVVFWLLEGRRPWSRLALVGYWGALGSLSVAGWTRQLARMRRFRHLHAHGVAVGHAHSRGGTAPSSDGAYSYGQASSNGYGYGYGYGYGSDGQPSMGSLGAGKGATMTEMLDAADRHVPTLGLNARRKFFHALAVLMFAPGIIIDPAFTHLAFSAAFALFTFAEYVRYFALYPFGAAVHVFLSEFLDHRDSGTAILSHFYLLTGCAGSLWLEGRKGILELTGVLLLGVGDALASIVGRRIGHHRWTPSSSKSLEGSLALVLSVWLCALVLRVSGAVEPFSLARFGAAVALGGGLEALSAQNDNLVLPLYVWGLGVLFDV